MPARVSVQCHGEVLLEFFSSLARCRRVAVTESMSTSMSVRTPRPSEGAPTPRGARKYETLSIRPIWAASFETPLAGRLVSRHDHSTVDSDGDNTLPVAARCGPWPDLPAQGAAWRLLNGDAGRCFSELNLNPTVTGKASPIGVQGCSVRIWIDIWMGSAAASEH